MVHADRQGCHSDVKIPSFAAERRGNNFAKRLKKGLTPYEFICKTWTSQPERFILNPHHQMLGLNI